jgi:hypothetical protein
MLSRQRCREGEERHAEQEREVAPHDQRPSAVQVREGAVVPDPEPGDDQKTEGEADHLGDPIRQGVVQSGGRRAGVRKRDLQGQPRHHHAKHDIADQQRPIGSAAGARFLLPPSWRQVFRNGTPTRVGRAATDGERVRPNMSADLETPCFGPR